VTGNSGVEEIYRRRTWLDTR